MTCREALRLAPGRVKPQVHLANALRRLRRWHDAAQAYRAAIQRKGDDASLLGHLGVTLRRGAQRVP